MNVFVVLIGTEEKHGSEHPEIIGPFESEGQAQSWLGRPEVAGWFDTQTGLYGGYPGIHIISAGTATGPVKWAKEHDFYADDVDEASAGYVAGTIAGMQAEIPQRP